jgi:hypothetical protein
VLLDAEPPSSSSRPTQHISNTSRTETGWADLGQFHSRPATSDERQQG